MTMWDWANTHPALFTVLVIAVLSFGPRELVATYRSFLRALLAPLPPRPENQ